MEEEEDTPPAPPLPPPQPSSSDGELVAMEEEEEGKEKGDVTPNSKEASAIMRAILLHMAQALQCTGFAADPCYGMDSVYSTVSNKIKP